MELLSQAPQQYVVAASCPWMGAWLCLMMQASHIPIDVNMLLEVKARSKVVHLSIYISTKYFHSGIEAYLLHDYSFFPKITGAVICGDANIFI